MFKYQQSQRQELIEFRNYIRQITSAKINQSQDKSPIKKTDPTKQLSFILNCTQLQQVKQKPQNNNISLNRTSYETSHLPRSASQTFVHFDANTWNENQNSLSKIKTQQITVNVSELVRISNALSQMGNKDINALSSNYLNSLHELYQTVNNLLKRID